MESDVLWYLILCGGIVGIVGVMVAGLAGVLFARGVPRRGLMVTLGLMLAGLLAWLGGGYILDGMGLAWRSWVNTACMVGGVLLFLVFMGLTISCLHRWKRHPALEAAVGLCALFVVLLLLMWGSLLIVFSYAPEREFLWQGRRVVEEDHSFLDPIYDYYDSHGLFIKEKEPFYTARAESARLEPEGEV